MASYGNIYSNGILPGNNDYYKRHNFSFRGNTRIKDGLAWLNYSINYIRKEVRNNMTGQGSGGSTIYQNIIQFPVNVDYGELKDYKSIYNNADNYYTPYAMNPWWILDHNYSTYSDDRIFGNIEFGLQLTKGLQFITRGGLDEPIISRRSIRISGLSTLVLIPLSRERHLRMVPMQKHPTGLPRWMLTSC